MPDRTRKPTRKLALALFPALLVACGEGRGWSGTMTDSAGVQIVTSLADGVWTDADVPVVTEELRFGATEGDPNLQFGQISGLDVGGDGTVYVLDQQARTVRAFDGEGNWLRTMGGPGSGPGELGQMSFGLIVAPGDTVLVPDMGQQRMTRYTGGGAVIGSFPMPIGEGVSVRWERTPSGQLIQQARIMAFPGQEAVEAKDLLLLRDASGTVTDTVLQMPAGQTLSMTESSMSIRMFEQEPVWTIGQDGTVYYAMNTDYSINAFSSDGTLLRIIRRAVERKPVTEADRLAFTTMFRKLFGDMGVPPQALDQVLGSVSFADHYPAFATLFGGPEGTLWVQQIRTAEEVGAAAADFNPQDMGSPNWDIFDAAGRYLGQLRLPDRFTPLRFVDTAIYGVARDELDVQHVARLRVGQLSGPLVGLAN